MLSDVSGAKSTKFISDISKTVKGELDIPIIKPLETIEEISKNIDS